MRIIKWVSSASLVTIVASAASGCSVESRRPWHPVRYDHPVVYVPVR